MHNEQDYPHRGMKSKTIKAVIRKKVDELIASVEDEALRELLGKDIIVTGGSIASMLLGEKVNDFDIYLRNHGTALKLANYYAGRFKPKNHKGIECPVHVDDTDGRIKIIIKSAGIASEDGSDKPYEYFESSPEEHAAGYVGEVMQDPGDIPDRYDETEAKALQTASDEGPIFRPVFMSTNAITLSGRMQIILRFYGEPDEIHKNYDYVHCTNYWDSKSGDLTLRQPALESLLARELRYVGSKYPICSAIRMRKFIRRGWTINAGQILKMVMQISELDLKDIRVLEDQLTGVDVAYFIQVIEALKEKDPEKVNAAYLVEILDRMF